MNLMISTERANVADLRTHVKKLFPILSVSCYNWMFQTWDFLMQIKSSGIKGNFTIMRHCHGVNIALGSNVIGKIFYFSLIDGV